MGRPKGSRNKPKAITTVVNENGEIIGVAKQARGRKPKSANEIKASGITMQRCSCCGQEKTLDQFYISNSDMYKFYHRMATCKECIWGLYSETLKKCDGDEKIAIFRMCQMMGSVFLQNVYDSSVIECESKKKKGMNSSLFKIYMKTVNSLPQYDNMEFNNGETITKEQIQERKDIKLEGNLTERDIQNRNTVIARLGHDPFEEEPTEDRKFLFNVLVDYLDDKVVNDNFLLMSIISIVKSQRQIAKLDGQISAVINDLDDLTSNIGTVKSLSEVKKNITASMLKTAEDNGISAKHNTNKSKGEGTLSGILAKLTDIGFESAKLNLFDIETSKSHKQIADVSNRSILQQIRLDDSEWSDMVAEQRVMILDLQERYDAIKEECRLLRIALRENGIPYDTEALNIFKKEIINVEWWDEELEKEVGKIANLTGVTLSGNKED